MLQKFTVKTGRRTELQEITALVEKCVQQSQVQAGCCRIYVPHTTAGLIINENADASVQKDIENALDTLIPWSGPYTHLEGNAAAHIKASLVGGAQTLFIVQGRLALGTWQGVFLAEFDGPRQRQIWVKIQPDF